MSFFAKIILPCVGCEKNVEFLEIFTSLFALYSFYFESSIKWNKKNQTQQQVRECKVKLINKLNFRRKHFLSFVEIIQDPIYALYNWETTTTTTMMILLYYVLDSPKSFQHLPTKIAAHSRVTMGWMSLHHRRRRKKVQHKKSFQEKQNIK